MTTRQMSFDEVIADNVVRIMEEKGVPIARLAERLGVSRASFYDLIRARPGRPLREFRWNEVVRLAGALDVLVFDLVLPADDVRVTGARWKTGLLEKEMLDPRSIPKDLDEIEIGALGAQDVSLALFGLPQVNRQTLDDLRRRLGETKMERTTSVEEEWRSLAERVESLLEELRNGND